jgi:signal-transduction protein with cAMP-binding, CBS, and nucleotidyltransferase domain
MRADAHGRLAGIVTDRDVCMVAYTQGVPLTAIPVERAMSARVVSCARGDDLETAHRLMRTHLIHRLPVVDTRGRPIGILSLSDLVSHARGSSAPPSEAVEVATTLYAIHRRRERASANVDSAAHELTKALKKKRAPAKKPSADLR